MILHLQFGHTNTIIVWLVALRGSSMERKDLNVTTEKTVLHVTEIHPKLLQKGIDLRYCQMFEFFLVNFDPNSGNVYALFC